MSNSSVQPHSTPPVIWEFLEPLQFLKAHYQYRKQRETHFSFAAWAQELGLKSRSFLRLVMIGKRSLTEDLGQQLSQNLKLNKSEALYFSHLLGLARASQLQAREFHSRELSKLRKKFLLKNHSIAEVQPHELYDFFSSYQIPRLQVLLTLENIEKTVGNLARLLKMKEGEVAQHLQTLQSLGLAQSDAEQNWSATESSIGTPDALGNIAVQSFHRKSLEEAIQALAMPKESRRYQALVMALTQQQFEELHEEFRQTFQSCLQKFEKQASGPQKIYQINLNIIPVTESIDRSFASETVETKLTPKDHEK